MWLRATKTNLMVFVAQKGHPLIQCGACHIAEEKNTRIGSTVNGTQHYQLHTAIISIYSSGVGHHCDIPDPNTGRISLSIWQHSVMKKHFWTLWACLVYLLCLWVALSSVFSPNWILCTHSHRRICISSYTQRIYLPHTHSTFAFMCLLPLCIMTVRALPSHLFAFPLNQPSVWGLSLNIKRSTRRKRCGSI